ncbi:MAG: hypothetical protein IJ007_02000 [Oscillospiraceae bacterium]|nr:hypothetical protein [Oscillospiraceae bacterium]
MKKSLIILLSILTLTACTPQTAEITTETSAVTNTAVTTAETTNESTSVTEEITSAEKITEAIIEESPQPAFKDNYDITDEELLEKFDEADTLFERGMIFINDGSGNFYSKENKTPLQYRDRLLNYFTEDCIDSFLSIYGMADTPDNGLYGNIIEFTINEDAKSYYMTQHDKKETDFIRLDITDFSNLSDYDTVLAGGQERTDISIMDYEILIKSREENKITLSLIVWHSVPECELVPNETMLCKLENGNIVYTGVYIGVDKDGNAIISQTELTGTINESVTENSYPEYLEKFDFYLLYDENREQWRFDCFHEWA